MTEKELVVKFFEEGYTNKNFDFIMECVAEDYIDNSPAAAKSNADAVNILKIVSKHFSDLKATVIDVFGEGNMVATRVKFEGVHTGLYKDIEPSGKPFSFEALENFKVVDGKIVESWGYWPDYDIEHKLVNN